MHCSVIFCRAVAYTTQPAKRTFLVQATITSRGAYMKSATHPTMVHRRNQWGDINSRVLATASKPRSSVLMTWNSQLTSLHINEMYLDYWTEKFTVMVLECLTRRVTNFSMAWLIISLSVVLSWNSYSKVLDSVVFKLAFCADCGEELTA
jgi:hypothetical protein